MPTIDVSSILSIESDSTIERRQLGVPAPSLHYVSSAVGEVSESDDSYDYPLLRTQPNWTLDDDQFRSPTESNSSVEHLLESRKSDLRC